MATLAPSEQPAGGGAVVEYASYSLEEDIAHFFTKTSVPRSTCDARARQLSGGDMEPIGIQGVCSYTVFAGPNREYVVQFRLKSVRLKMETARLAKDVYSALVPDVSFRGVLGPEIQGKEPLYVYLIRRVPGVTHLDFVLVYGRDWNSPQSFNWRSTLMADMARFYALSWKHSQPVDPAYREHLRQSYLGDLQLLLLALPDRFEGVIQYCIQSIDAVFSLPMVLLHPDLRTGNIIVEEMSCHLMGVVDWAEAGIYPFGLNLHCLEALTGKFHPRRGWVRFHDYDHLQHVFWETFQQEVGSLTDDCLAAVNCARITGLLLSAGFTSRLANQPEPMPIRLDDETGIYNLLTLDSLLIN